MIIEEEREEEGGREGGGKGREYKAFWRASSNYKIVNGTSWRTFCLRLRTRIQAMSMHAFWLISNLVKLLVLLTHMMSVS